MWAASGLERAKPRPDRGSEKLTFVVAALALPLLRSKQNLVPVLVRFEDLDLFHVALVVFLVFDLDCVSCGCIQVNFYTQVLCRS